MRIVGVVVNPEPMREPIVYRPADRPLAEALVDGRWVPAEIRMWVQHDDGTWTADVGYSPAPAETRLGTFPADRLRAPGGAALETRRE